MRVLCCLAMALTLFAVSFGKESVQSNLPPGLVATKPASGPCIEVDHGFMVPYTETIPGTDVTIEMVPVPGGLFTFGSSPDDEQRGENELYAVQVELPPFWVAKHEVTWSAYWQYMKLNDDFAKFESIAGTLASNNASLAAAAKQVVEQQPAIATVLSVEATYVDGVTAPTALYDESTTYECGQDPQQPAATMTPYAAKQFTKWLSGTTGTQYRLPTEAEWEYAARAGSETAYPNGDGPQSLDDYAWYDDNADYVTHLVGEKQPNAWGLHDMLGNVAEWVIDQYTDDLDRTADQPLAWEEAIHWPESNEARVARGGFYDSTAEDLRSTSRFYSEDVDWKASDPNSPLSPWWYTDYPSTGIGFRLVRSLQPLSPELIARFWEFNSEEIEEDVANRIDGRRAKLGAVNPNLPKAQAALEDPAVKALLNGEG